MCQLRCYSRIKISLTKMTDEFKLCCELDKIYLASKSASTDDLKQKLLNDLGMEIKRRYPEFRKFHYTISEDMVVRLDRNRPALQPVNKISKSDQ